MKLAIYAALLAVVSAIWPNSPANAQAILQPAYLEPESKQDIRHRMIVAENQLSIVEEISEQACFISLGIEPEARLARIRALRDMFVRAQVGLLDGDQDLGLFHPENHSRVIRSLREVDSVWSIFDEAIATAFAEGTVSEPLLQVFAEGDAQLLDVLDQMLAEVRAAYANPNELMMVEAMTLELLGRQKLLVEKIVKDACLIALQWNADLMRDKLAADVALFEKTQAALLTGMPAVGLRPPPNSAIAEALQGLSDGWAKKSGFIAIALDGGELDRASVIDFKSANSDLLDRFDAVLKLYEGL